MSSVVVLPILIHSGKGNDNGFPNNDVSDFCACLICSPCLIIASPFLLIKKLWDCHVTRKEKKKLKNATPREVAEHVNKVEQERRIQSSLYPSAKIEEEYDESRFMERKRISQIVAKCIQEVGLDVWELIERGSHNKQVVLHLQQQPLWVLQHIFEDLVTYWSCGRERMLFLKSQVGYTSMPSEKM